MFKCGYSNANDGTKCNYHGSYYYNVYAHYKRHHQEFQCDHDQCGRLFHQIGNLNRHKRIHTGEMKYSCNWDGCAYRGKQRSTAINHIRTVHFGWPTTLGQKRVMNIVDDRDARDYLIEH